MSCNLPLVRRSRRVLPWSGGLKLEINIPSQRIRAKWKGGLINEGGVISSEYGNRLILSGLWVLGEKICTVSNHSKLQCIVSTKWLHTSRNSLLGTYQPFSQAYLHPIYKNQAIGAAKDLLAYLSLQPFELRTPIMEQFPR